MVSHLASGWLSNFSWKGVLASVLGTHYSSSRCTRPDGQVYCNLDTYLKAHDDRSNSLLHLDCRQMPTNAYPRSMRERKARRCHLPPFLVSGFEPSLWPKEGHVWAKHCRIVRSVPHRHIGALGYGNTANDRIVGGSALIADACERCMAPFALKSDHTITYVCSSSTPPKQDTHMLS